MRTAILTALALSLLAAAPTAQRDGRGRPPWRREPVELKNFTFHSGTLTTACRDEMETDYGVYLPAGYDDEANRGKRYPWVIWLHGRNGDYRRFDSGAARILDGLLGAGKIPEMLVVTVSAGRQSLYFNGEPDGDTEDMITRDLVREIEKRYRVSEKREDRAIMGISIGGFAAFRFAFKHPDLFGAVAAHSAAMFPANPDDLPDRYRRLAAQLFGDPIDKDKWAKEIPTAMVAAMKPGALAGMRIYFDAGTADRYGFSQPNVDFHEALQKAGIQHTFVLVDGGGHSWNSGLRDSSIEQSFTFIGAGFARKQASKADASSSKKG